ncbi:uncharacterized protein BYT42DRAFT_543323 [Radiomyces spectabilis]|uniref:uncharacterized protein n=1 Tax=Radiomyces spectabilis TaxID=64574 RepID=UPI0022200AF2|nr:uncharacterized protein BYT42DRAFT_543323 [Radiomyces spectabilis]KAI8391836.1 hypothetical protein BYT42DRAFT_543323 [Radiomyces spectabilis]
MIDEGRPVQAAAQGAVVWNAPDKPDNRQKETERENNNTTSIFNITDETGNPDLKQVPNNTLDASGHVYQASESSSDQSTDHTSDHSNRHSNISNDQKDSFEEAFPNTNAYAGGETGENRIKERTDDAELKSENPDPTDPLAKDREFRQLHLNTNVHEDKDNNSDTTGSPKRSPKLSYPLPLEPTDPDTLIKGLELNALKYIVVACFVCYLCGRFRFGIFFGLLTIAGGAMAFWILGQETKKGLEWQLEKQEGMRTLYTSEGESVEWLNYIAEKIWRSIDPQIFALVEDILEDTLQSVAPSFIKAIKVTDFDIGVQAPRIQIIRVFPPLPGQPEESIFGEAAFSFHADPVASLTTKRGITATPPGIGIRFQTAINAPIDIKAELTAVSGKLRFKILTSPELPFISKVTIAFTSVPTIETGVMPLTKHLNIMNLPMIKAIVNEGVKLGFADLVDPKSMTIDIRTLIGAANQDTSAIGVVKVEIREAYRDASIDFQDMQDSYATLALSNQPKRSMSSSRVLTNDKDPRWNENLYILVHEDDIVSETKVDVKVWDADKIKFDDLWGSISISVKEIVQGQVDKLGNVSDWCKEERVIFDGWAPIDGKDEKESKVKLNFKMSFHPKYATRKPDLLSGATKKVSEMTEEPDEEAEEDIRVSPHHTNGILSVQIHQAVDLEIGDPEVLPADELKHPYNPNNVVSPYAVLYINDRKVYRTRAKLRNPSPHWNALTEHFIKNYDDAYVRISIKNSMELERDPVLGTKTLKLSEIFADQDAKFKESQKWIALANGIGFGKVLVTLKYKPVKLTLPRNLQGADVGTLIIDHVRLEDLQSPFDSKYASSTKAALSLNVDPVITRRLKAKDLQTHQTADGKTVYAWDGKRFYFPLMMRYRTALYAHISQGTMTSNKATGRYWLKEAVDNEWMDIVIGLQDHLSEQGKEANRNEDDWPTEGKFGKIIIRAKIIPGFSPVHTHLHTFNQDMVGADPFHDARLKAKAQKWIRDQSNEDDNEEENSLQDQDIEVQAAVHSEKEKRRTSGSSAETEDDAEEEDAEYLTEMGDQYKNSKISKHRVIRKLAWSTDVVKNKVEALREGFNSETRASRSVAKEV